jgi:glycosyltransferase involved in cell wall biosynthesis
MALGLPIVASDLEQIGEILEDGETAILVQPGDLDDLVAGFERVLALADRGRSLGLAARREAEANHTWDIRARSIVDSISANR